MNKPNYNKHDALQNFPTSLELKFKNKDAMKDFIARYLYSGGEQSIKCYVETVTEDGTWNTKVSYDWRSPTLFVNVEIFEEQ